MDRIKTNNNLETANELRFGTVGAENKRLTLLDPDIFRRFFRDGEVVEVRALNVAGRLSLLGPSFVGGTMIGFFDDFEKFRQWVTAADKELRHGGVYVTIQVIDPRLLARSFNCLRSSNLGTSDKDVLFYRFLPLDLDPVRPAGISSSDSELRAALELRDEVLNWIVDEMGLPTPVTAMSGNGAHALVPLPDLPVNDDSKAFIKNTLSALAARFNTDVVRIDTSVFNPARIWKLYGTATHKGDPLPAGPYREARPHRQSYIESMGGLN